AHPPERMQMPRANGPLHRSYAIAAGRTFPFTPSLPHSLDPLRVQTAQNVDLAFATAGLGDRILAFLVDITIVIAYYIVASQLLNAVGSGRAAWTLMQLPP